MTDGRKPYSLERRPSGLVIVEEGEIGVSDLAVFYHADRQLVLAVVHFLNGESTSTKKGSIPRKFGAESNSRPRAYCPTDRKHLAES